MIWPLWAIQLATGIKNRRREILGGILGAALALPLGYCAGGNAADQRHLAQSAKASVEALETAITANEQAAAERLNDALLIEQSRKDLTDAVKDLPDAVPSDRRVALACARLRAQGAAEADLPARCRSDG